MAAAYSDNIWNDSRNYNPVERRCKGGKERKGSQKSSKSLQANNLPNRGSTDGIFLSFSIYLASFTCLASSGSFSSFNVSLIVMTIFMHFTNYYKYHFRNTAAQGKVSSTINEEIYASQIQGLYHKVQIILKPGCHLDTYFVFFHSLKINSTSVYLVDATILPYFSCPRNLGSLTVCYASKIWMLFHTQNASFLIICMFQLSNSHKIDYSGMPLYSTIPEANEEVYAVLILSQFWFWNYLSIYLFLKFVYAPTWDFEMLLHNLGSWTWEVWVFQPPSLHACVFHNGVSKLGRWKLILKGTY